MFVRLGATARRRVRRGQSGAVAVEAALITPIIALLLFGVIEFGLLLNRHLAASNASREGARAAAASTNVLGSFESRVFTRLRDSLTGIPSSDVVSVVVYEAANNSNAPLNPGVDLDDLTTCTAGSRCTYWTPAADGGWESTTRQGDMQPGANGNQWFEDLDGCIPALANSDGRSRVGVVVNLRYRAFTPLLGSIIGNNRRVRDTTVMRVEPEQNANPCP